ncbi:hypothetical protein C1Y40_04214 [Mycobacterium talmoniae]|uniref:DUF1963 domain-containing protein n=2 Tax=Mycobacterium talmoniae TaxID=1858794 RepID=A0A1S1NP58_9MYCO|nr:hypothetical protein BKN37_07045 [Mycobacterium talmoniae]PQM45623.1 hypothetical protein C1Y40_04214 [Mycobacterium talmoniae]
MLWPENEAWPTCVNPWHFWDSSVIGSEPDDNHPHSVPNPLVPILQLFAEDAPTIQFPQGTDLLQVLWCPVDHTHLPDQEEAYAPAITVIWRNSADLPDTAIDPPAPVDFEALLMPGPCVLHPEQALEYPLDLPEDLWGQLDSLEEVNWNLLRDPSWNDLSYQCDLSVAPGTKVGGWPRWHASDPYRVPCPACGRDLDLLASFDTYERDDGMGHWDSSDLAVDGDRGNITGMILGRGGDLQIFYCPDDPRHPIHIDVQG